MAIQQDYQKTILFYLEWLLRLAPRTKMTKYVSGSRPALLFKEKTSLFDPNYF